MSMTAYEMMRCESKGFLEQYFSDLYNHDRAVLEAVDGEFCWFMRKNGTWIFMKDRDIGLIPSLDHLKTNLERIKDLETVKVFRGVNIPGKYELIPITIEYGLHLFEEWSKGWKKQKRVYQVFNLDGTLRGESTDKKKVWSIIGTSWSPYEVREKDSGNIVEEFITL